MYILFSIKIFSRVENNIFSFNSSLFISNSFFSKVLVKSVENFKISFTPKNLGFSSTITHAFGEMDTSQSVKAYNASIVILGD